MDQQITREPFNCTRLSVLRLSQNFLVMIRKWHTLCTAFDHRIFITSPGVQGSKTKETESETDSDLERRDNR